MGVVERDLGWFEAGVGAGAGPAPLERVVDESCFDRVAGDVAVDAEQVGVVLDPAGEAVGAEEMRASLVAAVVLA